MENPMIETKKGGQKSPLNGEKREYLYPAAIYPAVWAVRAKNAWHFLWCIFDEQMKLAVFRHITVTHTHSHTAAQPHRMRQRIALV